MMQLKPDLWGQTLMLYNYETPACKFLRLKRCSELKQHVSEIQTACC